MDGNKDEAQRCINIALEAAKSGDLQRAEKFLRKADSLYPSQKAKGTNRRKRITFVLIGIQFQLKFNYNPILQSQW